MATPQRRAGDGVAAPVNVTFPDWARFALGVLFFAITYLVTGDYVHLPEDARTLIGELILGATVFGIVPVAPTEIAKKIPPWGNYLLLAAVLVGGYLLNAQTDLEPAIRGVFTGLLALGGTIVVRPPQTQLSRSSWS